MVIAMGGAEGFFDYVVDAAEFVQVFRSEPERASGVAGEVVALPENAGAAFGTDD